MNLKMLSFNKNFPSVKFYFSPPSSLISLSLCRQSFCFRFGKIRKEDNGDDDDDD
jgi:hypothetical protein